jgi:hypothetical protein
MPAAVIVIGAAAAEMGVCCDLIADESRSGEEQSFALSLWV